MALTPEDVVNKRFQPTKFREGYDQDEVDDFLDEVVVELRRLNQDNEELRQRLTASEKSVGEQAQRAEAAPAPAAPAEVEPVAAPAYDPNEITNNTNNLLQLARKLHEEHVREGVEKRDSLIAEGRAQAARVISEAEEQQRTQISALDQQRSSLEGRIEELRSFEREYRLKLKNYIESQLHELDASEMNTNSGAASAAATAAPVGGASYESVSATPPTYQGFGGN